MNPILATLAVLVAAYVVGAGFGIAPLERIKTLLAVFGLMILVLIFALDTTGFYLP